MNLTRVLVCVAIMPKVKETDRYPRQMGSPS